MDATSATTAAPRALFESSGVKALLDQLDAELVGLAPVKGRIRDIAALLLIDKLRSEQGLQSQAPTLHMCFTGNPGTGKTTVALRMAQILHRLGFSHISARPRHPVQDTQALETHKKTSPRWSPM